jgi:uncharacterized protein YcfJ
MLRKSMLIATLIVAAAAPSLASAYTNRCEEHKHNEKVTGTVAGGLVGAIAGGALAGGHNTGTGAVLGGLAGAAIGNNMARDHRPCPDGYVRRNYDSRYYDVRRDHWRRAGYEQRCHWEQRPVHDRYGHEYMEDFQICR